MSEDDRYDEQSLSTGIRIAKLFDRPQPNGSSVVNSIQHGIKLTLLADWFSPFVQV